jgi:hypothetical protein
MMSALALVMAATADPAVASDTVDYGYDALGRLIQVSVTGGPIGGTLTTTGYDPAGNRCNYRLSTTGAAGTTACAAPGGGGGGGGGTNQPPVAVNDSGSIADCQDTNFAVLANDSDPDGNLPLALVSVSGSSARGTAEKSGNTVLFKVSGIAGTATVTYVMSDSLGATDSATLTITIGGCTQQLTAQPDADAELQAGDETPPESESDPAGGEAAESDGGEADGEAAPAETPEGGR